MNKKRPIEKGYCDDFTENDIKKAYRPIKISGWISVIIGVVIFIGMILGSIFIDIKIGLIKSLPLLLVIIIPALFYFVGLRCICQGLNEEKCITAYKMRAKLSIKIMLIVA